MDTLELKGSLAAADILKAFDSASHLFLVIGLKYVARQRLYKVDKSFTNIKKNAQLIVGLLQDN